MLTTIFAEPLRAAVGTTIAMALAHKDALYVRSHDDGMTIALPDPPQADEVALIIVIANRGRIDARVGGLPAANVVQRDGLR